jgi:soluble lytic murein transglycosylase-like protein
MIKLITLFMTLLLVACNPSNATNAGVVNSSSLIAAVDMAASAHKLDNKLLLSVAYVESKFDVKARNGSSVGLMQVHLRYHRDKFKGASVFNPYANMFVGAQILKECMNKMDNNVKKALRCYNGDGDKNYPAKVLKQLQVFKKEK